MVKKTIYTIERLKRPEDFSQEIKDFLLEEIPKLSKRFNSVFNYKNFSPFMLASKGLFLVGKRDGEVRGIFIAGIFKSPFDHETKILQQILHFVKPDSGRVAYHLFKKFIDIGKLEANHIITMLTSETNIKPQTLEKLGFKELETLYRMEV